MTSPSPCSNLGPGGGGAEGLPAFLPEEMAQCAVHLGGDVGQGCAHLLSGVPGLEVSAAAARPMHRGHARALAS